MRSPSRRQLLTGVGTAIALGLAGCSGAVPGGETTTDGTGGDGNTETTAAVPAAVADYMSNANGYDGVVDARGEDEVTVEVGAGDGFAFAPAAVRIDSGATVSWQWTGAGGSHNVVSTDDADTDVDSGDPVPDRDPFEQSFDGTGAVPYFCEIHRDGGMVGVVIVGDG